MGLNITVMSYCGQLDFGIVADREQMPDAWPLIDWLREAVEEFKPAAAVSAQAAGGVSAHNDRKPASKGKPAD